MNKYDWYFWGVIICLLIWGTCRIIRIYLEKPEEDKKHDIYNQTEVDNK